MKLHLTAKGFTLTGELQKYARRKVIHASRRLPRETRAKASCKVAFTRITRADVHYNTCSIVLAFDGVELRAEETTRHVYTALDIASVQIEQQLQDAVQRPARLPSRLRRGLKAEWPIV